MEYQVTRTGVKKLSREFRVIAGQLLRTAHEDGINNLRRFIKFIESSPLIYDFILKNQIRKYDFFFLLRVLIMVDMKFLIPNWRKYRTHINFLSMD